MSFFHAVCLNPLLVLTVASIGLYPVFRRLWPAHAKPLLANVVVVLAICTVSDSVALVRTVSLFRVQSPEYHHGFKSRVESTELWGEQEISIRTNSLGMRDASTRTVTLSADARRYVLLGDSFTEGVGVEYDRTFAGILDRRLRAAGAEALNLGVMSYSPKLYYHVVEYWLERGLEFDELYVFIDISDIQDELVYESWSPVEGVAARRWFEVKAHIYKYSFLARWLVDRLSGNPRESELWGGEQGYYRNRASWTADGNSFRRWGERGLELAGQNMDRLYRLSREHDVELTIAVYPWFEQILRGQSRPVQASFWRRFAEERGIGFINLFPQFVNGAEPTGVVRRYFIEGDIHWNAAGHQLVADRVWGELQRTRGEPGDVAP